jgi:Domain of unknown function (DUF4281)
MYPVNCFAKPFAFRSCILKSFTTISRQYRSNALPLPFTNQRTLPHHHSRSLFSCTAVLSPDTVFNIATLAVMPFYGLVIGAPKSPVTRKLMASKTPYYCAAALYLALLFFWNPLGNLWEILKASTFSSKFGLQLPNMTIFATAFNSAEATTLAWLHLVTLDLFQARYVEK